MSGNPNQLIAVVGATGTGKSEFAIDIAEFLQKAGSKAEIVNADAMQLYRGMDIGTAKLSNSDRRGVPHHLLDVLDITEEASVASYQRDARAQILRIQENGGIAILAGGSGLYVSSVLHQLEFPGSDKKIRLKLEAEYEQVGHAAMLNRLQREDPFTAEAIDANNARRIIRALEVLELTGRPKISRLPDQPVPWQAHRVVHLSIERETLIDRLNSRVERMWQDGLLDEVTQLRELGIERGVTASRAIGYSQALAHLKGTMSRNEAIESTRQATRVLARRQLNWFRRYRDAVTVDTLDHVALASALDSLTQA